MRQSSRERRAEALLHAILHRASAEVPPLVPGGAAAIWASQQDIEDFYREYRIAKFNADIMCRRILCVRPGVNSERKIAGLRERGEMEAERLVAIGRIASCANAKTAAQSGLKNEMIAALQS